MATPVQGLGQILSAMRRLRNIDYTPVAVRIKDSWVEQIYAVDAILTGRYIQSVDWKPISFGQDSQSFIVDTSRDALVTYSGHVEVGTDRMRARYPARRGIESADIGQTVDIMVEDALSPFFV